MVETVRCLILKENEMPSQAWDRRFLGLFLEKNACSKNPFALECPGGKIGDSWWQKIGYFLKKLFSRNTQKDQVQHVIREVHEETGIKLAPDQIKFLGDFKYKNTHTKEETVVHLFFVVLTKQVRLRVNKTLNRKGEPEDKHAKAQWLNLRKFKQMLKNKEGDKKGSISNNSKGILRFEKRLSREIMAMGT